jgi:ligand-binding sensor domain-containing protein
MKTILGLCLIAAMLSGCKKENVVKPTLEENQPAETFPEWVNYNTTNSALPNNQINAMAIDAANTKWIATANGLARLKDNQWTIYNTTNTSLPSANIQAVASGSNNTIWVGTDKGLAKFNGADWQIYTTANSVLTNNNIKLIAYDSKHNTTWIGTEEGLIKINNANNWEYIEQFHVIQSMTVDHDGALWLGVFNDFSFIGIIKKYQNGVWTSHRLDMIGYSSALPYGIGVDKHNNIVVALAGTVVKAVIRYNGNSWEEVVSPEKARGFKALAIQGDQIWVGGSTFSLFDDKSSHLITVPGTDSPILSMAIDSTGRKWLGTYYGGIAVYNSIIK